MTARYRIVWLTLAIAFTCWGVSRWFAPVAPTDRRSPAPQAPQRIASLTMGTDEMLADIVAPQRMVCVTYLVDDPEISNVRGFYPESIQRIRSADPEQIIGLNPDLVCVAPYNSADFLKVMERSHLPVYRNDAFHTMDEIEAGLIDLGKRVGEPGRAQEIRDRMHDRRVRLAAKLKDLANRPGVLYWSTGFTAGRSTTIDDIIREAGGINLAAERGLEGSAEISPEQVIATDPEVVLLSQWSANEGENGIENHLLLRNLRAVVNKRLAVIEGRYLMTVSQHVVEGAERLARKLHPDRFTEGDSPSRAAPHERSP